MTQAEVAKAASIARPNYVNFENGKRVPGTNLLGRFAEAVGVETRDLVRLDPEKTMLRDLRVLAGQTREECAAILGYKAVSSYSDIENGISKLSSEQIEILAEFLDVSLDELGEVAARPVRRRRNRARRSNS